MAEPDNVRRRLEGAFEGVLWNCRLIVVIPVVASLIGALAILLIATLDAVQVISALSLHFRGGDSEHLRESIIRNIIQMLDGFLLSTVMLVFAFGLYELFISRIDIAERSELGRRLLLIRDLDDLKDRLAKVILLILVVKFFEHALELAYGQAMDLLLLAGGILLVAAGLYLAHRGKESVHRG